MHVLPLTFQPLLVVAMHIYPRLDKRIKSFAFELVKDQVDD